MMVLNNNFSACLLYLAAFMFLNISLAAGNQSAAQEYSSYRVFLGERPPVDLSVVPKDAYEPGKIRIKLNPANEELIPEIPLFAGDEGYVISGNPSLDDLNRVFVVREYKPLFAQLYETESRSSQFVGRHRAWGFHLWLELLIDPEMNVIDAVKQFSALAEVDFAEPEYSKRLVIDDPVLNFSGPVMFPDTASGMRWSPNDPLYNNQWHYNNTGQQNGTPGADISLQDAWEIEKGNSNVIVAIIDGGIEYTHTDLTGNMWPAIGYNFVNGNANVVGDNHGTHVAGTVAAVTNNAVGMAGVAGGSGANNGVRLMSCQVFTAGGNGGFHLAPVYAADNGAAITQNSWNYSHTGVYEQSVLDAIDYFNVNGGGLAMNGGITIFSAGNNNTSGAWYPSYYSGCFSVVATNK